MKNITKEGIDNKVIFDQVKEYFKDALEGISVGGSPFKIIEGDLDNMFIAYDTIYAGDFKGFYNKSLYGIYSKTYATITKYKNKEIDKTPAAEVIWNSNSIQYRIEGDLIWREYDSDTIEFRKKPKPDNSKEIWGLKCEIEIMKEKIKELKQQMI